MSSSPEPATTPATTLDTTLDRETFNPWSVVRLVFDHLAAEGLHPVLGSAGDPGAAAAALLRALGVEPSHDGNQQARRDVRHHLEELRVAVLGRPTPG